MTQPDGLDQSWGFADPQTCANHGIKVVSMYLSSDPSKNATAAKIKAYHRAKSPLVPYGVGVWLNWEEFAGAPLQGQGIGVQHGYAAAQQVKTLIQQVGYAPKGRVIIPASYDFDSNPGQYPVIDAYARGFKSQVNPQGFGAGGYGEADLIEHLHADGLTEAEWQTYAWSGGRLSSEADFYQYMNGQTFAGASVDFNRVIHGPQMGAWWPPGHPLDSADSGLGGGAELTAEDEMTPEEKIKFNEMWTILHGFIGDTGYKAQDTYFLNAGKVRISAALADEFTAVRDYKANISLGLRADVMEQANKAVAPVLELLGNQTQGVVVQIAAVKKALADLATAVAALQTASVTPEQVAEISQAAKDGAASAVSGKAITLSGSIE